MSELVDPPVAHRAKPGPLRRYLPTLDWQPRYQPKRLAADLAAGMSVWALLVPQGLAYATVAAGSAAVVTPLVGASALGTSKAVPYAAALALAAGATYSGSRSASSSASRTSSSALGALATLLLLHRWLPGREHARSTPSALAACSGPSARP